MHALSTRRPSWKVPGLALGLLALGLGVAGAFGTAPEPGPPDDLRPWTLDGGGGKSTGVALDGGSYEVQGTIGQTDAGTHNSLIAQVEGGFWNAAHFRTGVEDSPLGRPSVHQLLPPAPNPFNPSTNVRFVLAQAAPVRLEILDVRGRLVRVLLNESLNAGDHERRWNGRDDRGGEVASGVYYLRMSTPDFTDTRKLALLK